MRDDRSHDLNSCCMPGTAPDSTEPPSILKASQNVRQASVSPLAIAIRGDSERPC